MTARKVAGVIAALFMLPLAALVVVNAWDYLRFHAAIRRLENLTEEQCRAMGDAVARVKARQRITDPAGFEILRPIQSNVVRNSADFLLYELKPAKPVNDDDHVYLYARISVSPSNQEIMYFTNSSGPQKSKVVWNRNPEFVKKHSPGGRILTVRQWTMSGSRSWMVLSDRILVVDERGRTGDEPSIAGSAVLDVAGMSRIKEAIANLPATAFGKDYYAEGVADGAILHLGFEPDDENGPRDVSISNTWSDQFGPLLNTVSDLVPKNCPIEFITWMKEDEDLRRRPTTIRTRAEREAINWGKPNLPWWCLWRKWLD